VCFSFQYSFFASDCWRLNYDLFENDFVGVVNLADTDWFRYVLQQIPLCQSDADMEALLPFNIDQRLLIRK